MGSAGYAFARSTRYSLIGKATHPAACVEVAPFSCAKASDAASKLPMKMRTIDLRTLRLSAESNARTGFFIVQSSLQLLWGCTFFNGRCLGHAPPESRMRSLREIADDLKYPAGWLPAEDHKPQGTQSLIGFPLWPSVYPVVKGPVTWQFTGRLDCPLPPKNHVRFMSAR